MTAGAARALGRPLLFALYGLVLVAPLVLLAGVSKAGDQSRVVIFADALGFTALSLLALQIVTSGRFASTTGHFGLRPVLALHRAAGVAVLALVVFHVGLLLLDDPAKLALLDWRTAPGRARAGTIALLGLVGLATSSALRARLRVSYERWRALHLVLSAVVLATAFAHIVWVDAYTAVPVVRWSVLALVLAAAGALFWTRVARPYADASRPYRVTAVRPERGAAITVELAPADHRGLRFAPGQFARLRAAHCLYGMDEHPFTLSSSADRPQRPAFTIKALGDFTRSLRELEVGTEVLVDGPHGEGAPDGPGVRGRILAVAGIGITPAMSVIRTAAERGDRRPIRLVYGSRSWVDVTFREELRALTAALPDLRVVHALSRPERGWRGECGRVDGELLRRVVPGDVRGWTALLCGPPAMVDELEAELLRMGLPRTAIQAEGF